MKHIFIMLMLITFIVSFAHAANELEDSLILYMSFDTIDDKSTIDHSLYENHGEMIGDPQHVEGKYGKALQFNGVSDYVEIPHHESLTVDQDVTVMAWIHAERHTGPNEAQWQGILAKGNNPRSYSLWTEANSKCLHFSVGPPQGGGSVCKDEVKLNEWQHVVAQVNNGTHRYWINGQNVGETGNKPDPPGAADTAPVVIGTAGGGGIRYFLGMIDEVRIWNRALSEEEINKQMEKGHFEIFPVDPKLKLTITWGNLKVQQR
jgi:hypothetical protein